MWAGAMAVTAACGRTCRVSAAISCLLLAHLEHSELGLPRHAREAEQDAGVVVVAFHRAMDLARPIAVERGVERFLRAGLSDRTGHADDRRFRTLAGRAAERLKRFERVLDKDVWPFHRLGDDRPCGPGFEGRLHEQMPS